MSLVVESPQRKEFHVDVAEEGADAPALLTVATGLSSSRIKKLMTNGALWLERGGQVGRLRRAARKLRAGDRLHLYFDPRIQAMQPLPARLLEDEGGWSLWHKPAGMFSHGSRWGDHCSLVRWAETHLEPRRNAFLVHRLDRAASGLMLIAHGRSSAARLARLFRERLLRKEYRVVVRGLFPAGEQCYRWPIEGREAVTRARLLEVDRANRRSLLQVEIETGRKHQIRRHLARGGFPVVGDRLYGGDQTEDLQLQAVRLAFPSPLDDRELDYRLPDSLLLRL